MDLMLLPALSLQEEGCNLKGACRRAGIAATHREHAFALYRTLQISCKRLLLAQVDLVLQLLATT